MHLSVKDTPCNLEIMFSPEDNCRINSLFRLRTYFRPESSYPANSRVIMLSKELVSRLPQLWRNSSLPSSNWYTVSVMSLILYLMTGRNLNFFQRMSCRWRALQGHGAALPAEGRYRGRNSTSSRSVVKVFCSSRVSKSIISSDFLLMERGSTVSQL